MKSVILLAGIALAAAQGSVDGSRSEAEVRASVRSRVASESGRSSMRAIPDGDVQLDQEALDLSKIYQLHQRLKANHGILSVRDMQYLSTITSDEPSDALPALTSTTLSDSYFYIEDALNENVDVVELLQPDDRAERRIAELKREAMSRKAHGHQFAYFETLLGEEADVPFGEIRGLTNMQWRRKTVEASELALEVAERKYRNGEIDRSEVDEAYRQYRVAKDDFAGERIRWLSGAGALSDVLYPSNMLYTMHVRAANSNYRKALSNLRKAEEAFYDDDSEANNRRLKLAQLKADSTNAWAKVRRAQGMANPILKLLADREKAEADEHMATRMFEWAVEDFEAKYGYSPLNV